MDKTNNHAVTSFTLPEINALTGGDNSRGLMGECLSAESASRMQAFRFPCRISAIVIGIGTEGETSISLDLRKYHLRKDSMFIYTPNNIFQVHSDEHFKAHVIAISTDFINRLNIDTKQMMPLFMQFGTHPCIELTSDECQTLRSFISLTEQELNGPETPYIQEIVSGLLSAIIYKSGEILRRYLTENPKENVPASTRNEGYFRQFMQLLSEYYKTERSVGFYARQLCITPKYLTTLIKRISGKSVSEWIDCYVILEAKTLLKYSNMSIQEIADYLSFANQSFFGCYFRRNTGMSPSQYKAQN